MNKQKVVVGIQSVARGYLTRLRFKTILEEKVTTSNQKSYERIMQRIKTIQSHWRGHEIRKVYKELKLDRHTKAMQVGYFNQQIELLGNEAFMSAMKTNYQINKNEIQSITKQITIKNAVKIEPNNNSTNKNNEFVLKSENQYPKVISRGKFSL